MTTKKSILTELLERRIPQILGMYVAAVWLAVEIADWMSERFDVPAQLSSYVFVVMIAFIPMVALLAWGHGRPGKDKWTQKQILFIPINAAIAYFAVTSFIKPLEVTEIKTLMDAETGQMVNYEVAKSGSNQKVNGFIWTNETNDPELDWLGAGATWLLSKDLMRSPFITMRTPYDSVSLRSALQAKGYEKAQGEPLSLDLKISQDRSAQWMIRGSITKEGEQLTFNASLYDVVTGALVFTTQSAHDDWLFALDTVADELGSVILKESKIEASDIPALSIAEHVSSNIGAIKSVISGLNAVAFDNDFEGGVEYLKVALESDEQLAEAYVLLIDYYRGLGDFESAKRAAEEALNLNHKLYQESVFMVKANHYAMNGQQDKAIRVLENWAKVHPESAKALSTLGSNYIMMGHHLDDALKIYEKLNDLQESSATSLINQAKIYRLKDDKDQAIKILNHYLSLYPDKSGPHLQLAAAYMQFGEVEKAKEHYDEASILQVNRISADLGLAKITAYQGNIDAGLQKMRGLLNRADTDQDRVKILGEIENILYLTGRIEEAMKVLEEMRVASQSFMAPLGQALMYGSKEAAYLGHLGDYEKAWAKLDELRANTKPPFDQLMSIIEKNIHDLREDHEGSDAALTKFKVFLTQFEMPVYDQFIMSSDAMVLRRKGEFEAALSKHNSAIAEAKQSVLTLTTYFIVDEFNYQKGLTLYQAGEYESVIAIMDEILLRNPLYGQCQTLKARALLAMNDLELAQHTIDQAIKIWAQSDAGFQELIKAEDVAAEIMAAQG